MGFFDYLGTFVKRAIFFIGGFIVAFPIAGLMFYTGGTWTKAGIAQYNINPVTAVFGIILFIVGIAMMGYAFKLER